MQVEEISLTERVQELIDRNDVGVSALWTDFESEVRLYIPGEYNRKLVAELMWSLYMLVPRLNNNSNQLIVGRSKSISYLYSVTGGRLFIRKPNM